MRVQTPGMRKYSPASALLASSTGLGWSAVSVEHRSHGVSEASAIIPLYVEICLVIAGNTDGLVRRNAGGYRQEAIPRTGAIWLSPAGISKEIAVTAPIPETTHIYLLTSLFDRLRDDFHLPAAPAQSIRNEAGIEDDVINQIGRSFLSAIEAEGSAGQMYIETASLALAARLLQNYCEEGPCKATDSSNHKLDDIRLRRVLDYVEAHINHNITLEALASVAGYSTFHFARKFTLAMGIAPHRYISRVRLDNAKAELAIGKLPLAQVALNAKFSSQASFTRAFHRATGLTPKEFQRLH